MKCVPSKVLPDLPFPCHETQFTMHCT